MSDNFLTLDANSVMRSMRTTEDVYRNHTPHHHTDSLPAQNIDPFSRLRVSTPGYRFDSQFTYQVDGDLWDVDVNGESGSSVDHDATERWAALTATLGVAGNFAILQSHYHAPYTPGRGQLAFITFLFGTALTEGERKVGYWDGSDGIYLRENSTGLSLVLASSTTYGDQSVAQASWNIDPMDGTGPSGLTLDTTKVQILVVALQALYVGRVLVAFDIEGELVPVHQFTHANEIAYPYMAKAGLPVRYEVTADDTAADVTMQAICASVISEGGNHLGDMAGRDFAAHGVATNAANNTVMLVIQPKAQLNLIDQHALVLPTDYDVTVEGTGCWIEIRRNIEIANSPTWTDVDAVLSVCEYACVQTATAPTTTDGSGQLIAKFYVGASANNRSSKDGGLLGKALACYSHLLATADNVAIIADGGSVSEVYVGLRWKEIR